jgi:hypothetical protein
MARIFLLSPAQSGGPRARILLAPGAAFDVARRVRSADGAALGEVFSFLSGLYFRGKLTYARRFAAPPRGLPGIVVITPGEGLLGPDTRIDTARLQAFASVPIDAGEPRYREPLLRDVTLLVEHAPAGCEFVLLGSIASTKYIEPLLTVLKERLLFPPDFVGRGDMSRGGLLLRCADAGTELAYAPVLGAVRHGTRPPRLPRLPRRGAP